ncbi:MAG: hypothetical protein VX379_02580 [Pseudomonadota bacterium]|uniref:hypothetical protein n=1 Tax=Alcanivorax sp. TaxID=1872427 RepID=UPI0025B80A45|nr:hypothetical protein [Alcanivorax sp.]MED5238441.1 hypothetical protein [Pseudomonadota bacterium]MEE3319612.1 hypothetical protein [Pseudomonadota bacterium]
MRYLFFLLFFVVMPLGAEELDFSVSSRSVSEPMAIKGFADQWSNTLHRGDIAWTRNRLEAGVRKGAFRVGYIQRYDYALTFNDETADLYYRSENDLPEPEGDVPVRLNAWHMRTQGAKFSWRWTAGAFHVEPALSLLSGWQFQDGSLDGFLRNESGELSGQAELDYRYSQDLLLDHQFERPAGTGLALDLTLRWIGEGQGVILDIQDAYGRMWWRDAPYTKGTFNTVDRDTPGEVKLDPAFTGKRNTEDYQQTLSSYTRGSYWLEQSGWRWSVEGEYFLERLWVRPGVSWTRLSGNPYMGYELRDGQWLLGLRSDDDRWSFELGSDTFKLENSRSLTVNAGYSLLW